MTLPRRYDVVSIGETMIRFSPKDYERVEQARSMDLHVGGSESNTLVGLARLGMSASWISRLTDNALGRMIARGIAAHGVDTRWIRWTHADRVGIYFYEQGQASRASHVIYDRADSAFARMTADDLPTEPLEQSRLLHVTGISLALSDSVRQCLRDARDIAAKSGAKLSFDFNYRSKLWSMADARLHCSEWIEGADLVFLAHRDASEWLGVTERISEESVFARVLSRRKQGVTIMTLGSQGAMASDGRRTVRSGTNPVEGAGRLGAGDAFSAGFLFGWLQGWDMERSLQWANAAAQSKLTTPGDLPWFTAQELEALVEGNTTSRLIR